MTDHTDLGETPPSVRFLRRLSSGIESHGRLFVGIIIGLGAVLWVLSGVYTVENGKTAIIKRFGRVSNDSVEPGIQFRLPAPIESEQVFASGEVFRLEIAESNGAKLQFISGDENLIATSLVVQYMVTNPPLYLYGCDAPEEIISLVANGALLETMAEMEVDEILTTGKARIQNRVRETTQRRLREYNLGVSVLSTTLQSVEPPTEAAIAFRAVQDSRTESSRTRSDAEMLREHILSLTRAEANRMVEEARAESEGRVHDARGAADRFGALLVQHRASPQQTQLDLYHGQIDRLLTRSETIILGPGESPKIDINMQSRIVN